MKKKCEDDCDFIKITSQETPLKFDPQFKPRAVTIQEAKNLTCFIFVGPPGVGKSFFFNMLCRDVRHDTGNSMGGGKGLKTKPDIIQISETSCVIDTMGLHDTDPEVDAQSRELLDSVLQAGLTDLRVIFLSDTRAGRLPAAIVLVAQDLFQAVKGKRDVPKHNLVVTMVPEKYMEPNQRPKFTASVMHCWKEGLGSHQGQGLHGVPFLFGYREDYEKLTDEKQVAPLCEDFWTWLHNDTASIEVDPAKVKKFEAFNIRTGKTKQRELRRKLKQAEKDEDAIAKLEKQIKNASGSRTIEVAYPQSLIVLGCMALVAGAFFLL